MNACSQPVCSSQCAFPSVCYVALPHPRRSKCGYLTMPYSCSSGWRYASTLITSGWSHHRVWVEPSACDWQFRVVIISVCVRVIGFVSLVFWGHTSNCFGEKVGISSWPPVRLSSSCAVARITVGTRVLHQPVLLVDAIGFVARVGLRSSTVGGRVKFFWWFCCRRSVQPWTMFPRREPFCEACRPPGS